MPCAPLPGPQNRRQPPPQNTAKAAAPHLPPRLAPWWAWNLRRLSATRGRRPASPLSVLASRPAPVPGAPARPSLLCSPVFHEPRSPSACRGPAPLPRPHPDNHACPRAAQAPGPAHPGRPPPHATPRSALPPRLSQAHVALPTPPAPRLPPARCGVLDQPATLPSPRTAMLAPLSCARRTPMRSQRAVLSMRAPVLPTQQAVWCACSTRRTASSDSPR